MDKNNLSNISLKALKISQAANLGMLYDICTSPSPGLVSPFSTGAHKDMDIFTFLKSIAAILPTMTICAELGLQEKYDLLPKLRRVGVKAEKEMFAATKGVNTQKGFLFLGGVVSAAGSCIRLGKPVNRYNISNQCKYICKDIVEKELLNISKDKVRTNGERIFLEYGITGIRGEIENGLPSVLKVGLLLYEEALTSGLSINEALSHTLVGLMTVVEDSTVINRYGMEGLIIVKKHANKFLNYGGMYTEKGREYIKYMELEFIDKNISPGGCADILAITVMIKKLEEDFK
ncbi:triphosphoribosyl-dephospho-CoA synthase [Schnuerera sp. xch1]|uniref:triphosphoribosyl-dephospho-CoA synthase n=1 Tax=Schnuerera sp. xch1 TaxID=2874283 RepID=UPI001CC0DF99|nr:triphosphoribosyl-dephospho-CoA synthase [Schnuerera sp. xch1]MBZ2174029.1 triphosphoribosyl-dephospho-CoA synthase [Schnuerera sp. xch1]